ncbi:MAG: peptidase S41, partial [Muribaculaceae bacterium]|nr:peptidase S41 [Muribaculaceae bacterium]
MKNVIVLIMCAASVAAGAAETPLWLRNPAISPDGKTIAFSYKGDIYTVPSTGGTAKQITTNAAYDSDPVWSPDGSNIAFASDRAGGLDVYVTSADGGAPMRITTHSAKERPMSYLNADTVLVMASIQPSMTDRQFPGNTYPQVYAVPLTGGRPVMYSALSMEQVSVNPVDGRVLYTDKKGYEDAMRKHHTSSVTRDVWMADRGKHTKMTTYKGENRNGVWASGGKDFYYLSEEDGTFNVYKRSMATGATTQLTKHTMHPVRSLTAANDGTMSYSWNGELYTLKEGGEPQRVDVVINGDVTERDVVNQLRSSGATDIAVSPDGKEVAFVVRGDVYVANVE